MRIEHFSDEHGIYVRASEEAFLVTKEQAASIREYIDRLRELAERAWKTAERLCQAFDGPCSDDGVTIYKPCPMGERDEECVYGQLRRELRELGIEVDDASVD